ncbi:MAG: hypothetical protein EXR77_08825 [Myxococcales bacterium]|nr:hypothetical protein [Myxococcales bacterium]
MTDLRAREKKKLFMKLLESAITALHLDPRRVGVIVPGRFRIQNWLVLNYSYRYGIADFRFDDQIIEATLSFGGQPFYCRVPWSAVFAITDSTRQRGRIWHDEVPSDVDDAVRSGAAEPPTIASGDTIPRPVAIRAVPASKSNGNTQDAPQRPTAATDRKPIGLHLIAGGRTQSDPQQPPPEPPTDSPIGPASARPKGSHLRRVK